MRLSMFAALLGALLCPAVQLFAAANSEIISELMAEQHGLARCWIAQVQVDRGQGRVQDILLYDGVLYLQTSRATIHALNAETGQTLWAKRIGRPDHPSMPPGAFRDLLATVNGSRLYVVNRYTGDVLFETQVNGAPGAGPTLSSKRVYVPMVSGMIFAYRVEPLTDPMRELGKLKKQEGLSEEEKKAQEKAEEEERRQNIRVRQDYVPPFACQSAGRALVQPTLTWYDREEEFCAWPTDRGFINFGRIDRRSEEGLTLRYRVPTREAIVAPVAYLPPTPKVVGEAGVLYAASQDGYVYAIIEKTGELLWKFSAGEPLVESPVVIGDRCFAATLLSGMYCLDAKSGKQHWWAAEVVKFVAAGKQHVYAADKLGRLRILDSKTGAWLDSLPTELLPLKYTNRQTDRIYVGNQTGLLHCLREIEQSAPIDHNADRKIPRDDLLVTVKSKGGAEQDGDKEKPSKPKLAAKDRPAREPAAPPRPRPSSKKPKDDTGFDNVPPGGADDAGGKKRPSKSPSRTKGTKAKGKGKDGDADANPFQGGDKPF